MVARLGVSRTPIRLALDRLANEGLLEVLPGGGFVVREFTVAEQHLGCIGCEACSKARPPRLAAERLTNDRELNGLALSR